MTESRDTSTLCNNTCTQPQPRTQPILIPSLSLSLFPPLRLFVLLAVHSTAWPLPAPLPLRPPRPPRPAPRPGEELRARAPSRPSSVAARGGAGAQEGRGEERREEGEGRRGEERRVVSRRQG
eukprot:549107-Rhodomonas_salina.1